MQTNRSRSQPSDATVRLLYEAFMRASIPSPRRSIGLVACAKSKYDSAAAAQWLYNSVLFNLSRDYAKRFCDEWYILSAKHGLLSPSKMILPYNQNLRFMPAAERAVWRNTVRSKLESLYASSEVDFVVLAGQEYAKALEGLPNVETPLIGLGIGQRIAWLKKELKKSNDA